MCQSFYRWSTWEYGLHVELPLNTGQWKENEQQNISSARQTEQNIDSKFLEKLWLQNMTGDMDYTV